MDTKSNDVICSKTWTDLNIDLSKHTFYFCCKASAEPLQSLKLNDILYAPGIVNRRADSINGLKNSQCDYCWKSNSAYRNIHNRKITVPDNPLDSIEFIELTLENTCNLSCLYCSAPYSSTIAKEQGAEHTYKSIEYKVDEILELLIPIIKNRKIYFNVVGGEPTMSKFYYQLIESLIKQVPNEEFVFITTSNGDMHPNILEKLSYYMNQTTWQWVWGFSGEAAGESFNNIRFHGNYERWLNNMRFFSQHSRTRAIALNPAVNQFCLKTFPTYMKDVLDIVKDRMYIINGNYVSEPEEFCISNLDKSFATYIQQARDVFVTHSANCINPQSVFAWFDELESMLGSSNTVDVTDKLQSLNKQKDYKLDINLLLKQLDI